jgi:hypothetical protein
MSLAAFWLSLAAGGTYKRNGDKFTTGTYTYSGFMYGRHADEFSNVVAGYDVCNLPCTYESETGYINWKDMGYSERCLRPIECAGRTSYQDDRDGGCNGVCKEDGNYCDFIERPDPPDDDPGGRAGIVPRMIRDGCGNGHGSGYPKYTKPGDSPAYYYGMGPNRTAYQHIGENDVGPSKAAFIAPDLLHVSDNVRENMADTSDCGPHEPCKKGNHPRNDGRNKGEQIGHHRLYSHYFEATTPTFDDIGLGHHQIARNEPTCTHTRSGSWVESQTTLRGLAAHCVDTPNWTSAYDAEILRGSAEFHSPIFTEYLAGAEPTGYTKFVKKKERNTRWTSLWGSADANKRGTIDNTDDYVRKLTSGPLPIVFYRDWCLEGKDSPHYPFNHTTLTHNPTDDWVDDNAPPVVVVESGFAAMCDWLSGSPAAEQFSQELINKNHTLLRLGNSAYMTLGDVAEDEKTLFVDNGVNNRIMGRTPTPDLGGSIEYTLDPVCSTACAAATDGICRRSTTRGTACSDKINAACPNRFVDCTPRTRSRTVYELLKWATHQNCTWFRTNYCYEPHFTAARVQDEFSEKSLFDFYGPARHCCGCRILSKNHLIRTDGDLFLPIAQNATSTQTGNIKITAKMPTYLRNATRAGWLPDGFSGGHPGFHASNRLVAWCLETTCYAGEPVVYSDVFFASATWLVYDPASKTTSNVPVPAGLRLGKGKFPYVPGLYPPPLPEFAVAATGEGHLFLNNKDTLGLFPGAPVFYDPPQHDTVRNRYGDKVAPEFSTWHDQTNSNVDIPFHGRPQYMYTDGNSPTLFHSANAFETHLFAGHGPASQNNTLTADSSQFHYNFANRGDLFFPSRAACNPTEWSADPPATTTTSLALGPLGNITVKSLAPRAAFVFSNTSSTYSYVDPTHIGTAVYETPEWYRYTNKLANGLNNFAAPPVDMMWTIGKNSSSPDPEHAPGFLSKRVRVHQQTITRHNYGIRVHPRLADQLNRDIRPACSSSHCSHFVGGVNDSNWWHTRVSTCPIAKQRTTLDACKKDAMSAGENIPTCAHAGNNLYSACNYVKPDLHFSPFTDRGSMDVGEPTLGLAARVAVYDDLKNKWTVGAPKTSAVVNENCTVIFTDWTAVDNNTGDWEPGFPKCAFARTSVDNTAYDNNPTAYDLKPTDTTVCRAFVVSCLSSEEEYAFWPGGVGQAGLTALFLVNASMAPSVEPYYENTPACNANTPPKQKYLEPFVGDKTEFECITYPETKTLSCHIELVPEEGPPIIVYNQTRKTVSEWAATTFDRLSIKGEVYPRKDFYTDPTLIPVNTPITILGSLRNVSNQEYNDHGTVHSEYLDGSLRFRMCTLPDFEPPYSQLKCKLPYNKSDGFDVVGAYYGWKYCAELDTRLDPFSTDYNTCSAQGEYCGTAFDDHNPNAVRKHGMCEPILRRTVKRVPRTGKHYYNLALGTHPELTYGSPALPISDIYRRPNEDIYSAGCDGVAALAVDPTETWIARVCNFNLTVTHLRTGRYASATVGYNVSPNNSITIRVPALLAWQNDQLVVATSYTYNVIDSTYSPQITIYSTDLAVETVLSDIFEYSSYTFCVFTDLQSGGDGSVGFVFLMRFIYFDASAEKFKYILSQHNNGKTTIIAESTGHFRQIFAVALYQSVILLAVTEISAQDAVSTSFLRIFTPSDSPVVHNFCPDLSQYPHPSSNGCNYVTSIVANTKTTALIVFNYDQFEVLNRLDDIVTMTSKISATGVAPHYHIQYDSGTFGGDYASGLLTYTSPALSADGMFYAVRTPDFSREEVEDGAYWQRSYVTVYTSDTSHPLTVTGSQDQNCINNPVGDDRWGKVRATRDIPAGASIVLFSYEHTPLPMAEIMDAFVSEWEIALRDTFNLTDGFIYLPRNDTTVFPVGPMAQLADGSAEITHVITPSVPSVFFILNRRHLLQHYLTNVSDAYASVRTNTKSGMSHPTLKPGTLLADTGVVGEFFSNYSLYDEETPCARFHAGVGETAAFCPDDYAETTYRPVRITVPKTGTIAEMVCAPRHANYGPAPHPLGNMSLQLFADDYTPPFGRRRIYPPKFLPVCSPTAVGKHDGFAPTCTPITNICRPLTHLSNTYTAGFHYYDKTYLVDHNIAGHHFPPPSSPCNHTCAKIGLINAGRNNEATCNCTDTWDDRTLTLVAGSDATALWASPLRASSAIVRIVFSNITSTVPIDFEANIGITFSASHTVYWLKLVDATYHIDGLYGIDTVLTTNSTVAINGKNVYSTDALKSIRILDGPPTPPIVIANTTTVRVWLNYEQKHTGGGQTHQNLSDITALPPQRFPPLKTRDAAVNITQSGVLRPGNTRLLFDFTEDVVAASSNDAITLVATVARVSQTMFADDCANYACGASTRTWCAADTIPAGCTKIPDEPPFSGFYPHSPGVLARARAAFALVPPITTAVAPNLGACLDQARTNKHKLAHYNVDGYHTCTSAASSTGIRVQSSFYGPVSALLVAGATANIKILEGTAMTTIASVYTHHPVLAVAASASHAYALTKTTLYTVVLATNALSSANLAETLGPAEYTAESGSSPVFYGGTQVVSQLPQTSPFKTLPTKAVFVRTHTGCTLPCAGSYGPFVYSGRGTSRIFSDCVNGLILIADIVYQLNFTLVSCSQTDLYQISACPEIGESRYFGSIAPTACTAPPVSRRPPRDLAGTLAVTVTIAQLAFAVAIDNYWNYSDPIFYRCFDARNGIKDGLAIALSYLPSLDIVRFGLARTNCSTPPDHGTYAATCGAPSVATDIVDLYGIPVSACPGALPNATLIADSTRSGFTVETVKFETEHTCNAQNSAARANRESDYDGLCLQLVSTPAESFYTTRLIDNTEVAADLPFTPPLVFSVSDAKNMGRSMVLDSCSATYSYHVALKADENGNHELACAGCPRCLSPCSTTPPPDATYWDGIAVLAALLFCFGHKHQEPPAKIKL